ncbi:MAG: DUF881 domain-containing protein [Actinomycetota bacterium]|nr:DUF881 domain-containing protein [Actinomycetota bacterium]MDQ2957406.1 DUF881 domain-containing protein [Actinomycetota bacterium]
MTEPSKPEATEPASTPKPAAENRPEPDRATKPKPAGRRLNRGSTVLIGALLALLGFGLAVQLRSNSQTDSLSGAREDDLVRILDDQNGRIDRLQSQISDLQAAKQRLSDSGSNNAAARQEAQRQADALAVLTGTAPAHGPGLSVTITDPSHALKAEDLLDVVEELRGAGAEVIQFGPVRVAASSAFTDNPDGVQLDKTTIGSPYTVLAIGDPKTLDTALNITGGVVNTVHTVGGEISIAEQDSVSITAVRTVGSPKYATPTGK